MDISKYQKVDQQLFKLSQKLGTLRRIHPKNYQQEKELFLNGKSQNPRFEYSERIYDTAKFDKDLKNLKPPNDEIGSLQKELISVLRIKNGVIKNRGNKKIVIKISKELFGKPSNQLIHKARNIIKRTKEISNEKYNLTAKEIANRLKKSLAQQKDWKIKIRNKYSVSINPATKTIRIGRFQKYSKQSVKRLINHEISTHLFRAENGYQQPLKMFALGLPGYLPTEEGIAAYLEGTNKATSIGSLKRFALRVLAVDLVYNGANFAECFDKIHEFEEDDDKCWEIVYRVFRGGGYLKDQVYLKGYYQIKEFIKNGGNLNDLYIGKIGLQHLELCKELLDEGFLKPPKYLPLMGRIRSPTA